MLKIVFLVSNLAGTHERNRIEEFISSGYDVEVYGFYRVTGRECCSTMFIPHVLGEISPKYRKRIKRYYRSVNHLVSLYGRKNVIYYVFGLDQAMFFAFKHSVMYIYEEADLVYTYINSNFIKSFLKSIDKYTIKKSLKTVLTSEGFSIYHFGNTPPKNICVVTNRLNSSITKYPNSKCQNFNKERLRIGFVGAPRFKSIKNFISVFCNHYPNYEFHIYGAPIPDDFAELYKFDNCYFHGKFTNPDDLPSIYSSIDLVLSTYDAEYENVRYAEPNKIYECIYFKTPIIVSSGTYLADKVSKLGIGFSINAMEEKEIIGLINSLSLSDIIIRQRAFDKIPVEYCLDFGNVNRILSSCF